MYMYVYFCGTHTQDVLRTYRQLDDAFVDVALAALELL